MRESANFISPLAELYRSMWDFLKKFVDKNQIALLNFIFKYLRESPNNVI